MAVYKQDIVDIELNSGNIHRSFLKHSLGKSDTKADHFGIRVFRGGEPEDLTGVSVQGYFKNPQGTNIAITSGNIVSGNLAEVVLPQACYNYEGQFCLAIKLVGGGVTGTMRIVDGMIDNTNTGSAVAPTSAVPTYQEILAQYDAMVAATAAANGAIAATYSSSSTYKVGDYCIHDGGLYRCTTAITTAEAWTAGHWTAAKIGPDVSDLKSALDNVTSYRDAFNGFVHKGVSGSGYVITNNDVMSVFIEAKTAYYIIKATGNMNRFILYGVNSDLSATEVFRYTSGSVPNPAEYTYHNTDYVKLLLVVYYGTSTSISVSMIESPTETIPGFSVNGIDVLTKNQTEKSIQDSYEETLNRINGITPYRNVFNGFVHKGVSNTGYVITDANVTSVFFDASAMYYKFKAEGNMNRFILFGVNSDDSATEIFRYTNNNVPNPAEYTYQNTSYAKLLLVAYYGSGASVSVSIIESQTSTLPAFSVEGVELFTKEQTMEEIGKAKLYNTKFTTISSVNGIEGQFAGNLMLIAIKTDNTYYGNPATPNGRVPCARGYLYLNATEQKLYYSSGRFDKPEYLCDWKSSIASGLPCQQYHATITKDGDIIFFKRPYNNTVRTNPIIYPHGDYNNPYEIDFGNDIKPFGFAVDSGVEHSYNGDFFMYGEYRGWSVDDNDEPIYIWKVVKPYNTKSCWSRVCTKYVRHFNSGPGTHPGEEIGHFHTMNFDFYSGAWIASTGDVTFQIKMLMSKDNGETWVDQGVAQAQSSRTVGMIFTKDGMYYQTDSTNANHALYYASRGNDGYIDFSTLSKVCDLSNTGAAGYGCALMREPYGILFIDRMEEGAVGVTTLPLYFYSLETNKLIHLMNAKAIEGYDSYDLTGRFGLPVLAITHYQSPYEDGIIMGATTITKPLLLDIAGNKKDILVGTIKMSLM